MPTPILTISDFSGGVLDDPTEQSSNGFQEIVGIDIFSNPGVLRPSPAFSNETSTAVVALITAIDNFDGDGTDKLYGFDGSKVYKRTTTTWSVDRTLSGTTALTDTPTMLKWNGAIYYATKNDVGRLTGTTYDDDYLTTVLSGTLPAQDAAWKPMKGFLDKLFIGDGRYVSSINTSAVFTAQELVLPLGNRIRQIEIINDRLALACGGDSATGGDPSKSTVFIWDGVDTKPEAIIEVNTVGGSQALKTIDNVLFLFARNTAPPAPAGIDIYYYNGADFELFKTIRNAPGETDSVRMYSNAVENFNNDLLFGTSIDSGSGQLHGIWKLGRIRNGQGRVLTLASTLPSAEESNVVIGAVKVFGNQYFASYKEGSTYRVAASSTTAMADGYIKTQYYEIDQSSFSGLVKGVKIFAKPMPSNTSITVLYDITDSGTYTSLGTISSTNQNDILYGIYKRVDRIQFKLYFTSSSQTFPEVFKIEVY